MNQRFIPAEPVQFFKALPKVDLHRHLEGSLRIRTIMEIVRAYGLTPPQTAQLRPLVQVQAEEALNFRNFLSKFQTLRLLYRSHEIITRITREAVADAAADRLYYLELRFTPVALARDQGFSMEDVMDLVCDSAAEAADRYGVQVGLSASVNRHEDPLVAEHVAQLAVERIGRGIYGLDLAGNEAEFSAEPFEGIFREARQSGLRITAHAGEWSGPESVRHAICQLGAERIGHGVRVLEDPDVTALAREHGTTFDVCLTSNFQTGAVPTLRDHPLPAMIRAGLNVTINTDDPSISQITLTDELLLAYETLNLSVEEIIARQQAAARAAFLPDAQREHLMARLEAGLNEAVSPDHSSGAPLNA